jgi:hypothetical protein
MCLSCGCGIPDEDHGDRKNITMTDIEDAADAAGLTVDEVLDNIETTLYGREEEREIA